MKKIRSSNQTTPAPHRGASLKLRLDSFRRFRFGLPVLAVLMLLGAFSAQAALYIKTTTTSIGQTTAWTPAGIPGPTDIGEWTSAAGITGCHVGSASAQRNFGQYAFANDVATNVTILVGYSLTISGVTQNDLNGDGGGVTTYGIDMSTANVDVQFSPPALIIANPQTWIVDSRAYVDGCGCA